MKKAITAALTPVFRLSYPSLFMATEDMNGKNGYRIEMLFPKATPEAAFDDMRAMHDAAIPGDWKRLGARWRTFDEARMDGDAKEQAERKGRWIMRATSGEKFPPRVVNFDMSKATEADVYAGCRCRAILTVFTYDAKGNKGVAFNLHTVQKIGDGDPFGAMLPEVAATAMLLNAPVVDVDELLS